MFGKTRSSLNITHFSYARILLPGSHEPHITRPHSLLLVCRGGGGSPARRPHTQRTVGAQIVNRANPAIPRPVKGPTSSIAPDVGTRSGVQSKGVRGPTEG